MNSILILTGAGIVLCIFLSNFFSSSEMAYSSANEIRLESAVEEGDRKAGRALYIIRNFDDALSAILIGNNLVNIAASSLTSVFIILLTGTDALAWVGTATVTVLIIIFGETIPKITAKKKANTLAAAYSGPIRFLMTVFYPLIRLVVWLTELITRPIKEEEDDEDAPVEELQSIIETAEDEGILDKDRTELIRAAIDFSDISASEAMTSRVDMDAIDIDDPYEEIRKIVEETSYSRLPVYEGSIDNIIGVVHLNHILKAMMDGRIADIREYLMPPCYVYKTVKLPEVLSELRRVRQHLAVVTDEYGGTLGVITMEDVLEEIVGDIWDETDEIEEEVAERNSREFEIDGDMSLDSFLETVGLERKEEGFDSETAGGWIIESLGHYPEEGETWEYEDYTFRVLETDERRVEKILVRLPEVIV